jgi:hypothetical protein
MRERTDFLISPLRGNNNESGYNLLELLAFLAKPMITQ